MPVLNKSVWKTLSEYALVALGILMYVLGWTLFLIPNNLVGGGVTGLSSILQYATHGVINAGWSYGVINILLLIVALRLLGKSFGSKTIFAVVLASVGLSFLQKIIPQGIIQSLALENGKLMSTIMGGMLAGAGIGMTMSQGGSTGGTDIIALVVNKYRNVSPGRMILWIDVAIILSSLFFPSYMPDGSLMGWSDKITTVVYGFILVVVNSTVLDLYISGSRQSVQLFVLSDRFAEIADAVTNDLHKGVTVLDGEGWYTKQSRKVLMIITRKTELNIILRYIKSIDSNAFLSVSSVTGVYGKGFDTIKAKTKEKH
ncbi:MAG: YitT family protein [Bacteroidales bacterium]|nr:YitT family protein [Bacteroidales bacterium]MCI5482683.1 YitT family protein [Bacteroidales bacterium]MDD6751129.1 YitT family protein [Bacteroidales bacterium]MDY2878529.1 YitT family protein [Candidatus Cryptobacteroides sp.]